MQPLDARPPRSPRGWLALIFLAGSVIYLPTVRHGFVYDDVVMVSQNTLIQHPRLFPYVWTRSYLGLPRGKTYGQIRPVTSTSHAVTWWLVGDRPSVFHLSNAFLHAVNGVLLFGLARQWLGSDRAAGLAAMAFALHPVHTEAVANVVGRGELLMVLFGLLAWRLHRGGTPTVKRAAGSALLYLAALLSKGNALPLFALFIADDWLFGREARRANPRTWWRGRALLWGGHGVALLLYFTLRLRIVGELGATPWNRMPFNPLSLAPLSERLPTALALIGLHWRLFLWPWPLRPDYSFNTYPLVESLADPRLLAALATLACLTALALWGVRRSPGVTLGVLLYLLGIALTSNIPVAIGHLFAERNLYLPSAGMCLVAAVGTGALWQRWPVTLWALVAVGIAWGVRTVDQSRIWRDDFTLFSVASETTPDSTTVWGHLAGHWITRAQVAGAASLERQSALREAERCARRALAVWPQSPEALTRLAQVALERREFKAAERQLELALEHDVGQVEALMNWTHLASVTRDFGPLEERALAALDQDGWNLAALRALAIARFEQGRLAEAQESLERMVELRPFNPTYWELLAEALRAAGDDPGAEQATEQAARVLWVREFVQP